MVQEMLDHGADPHKISSEGITPFQKAMAVLDPDDEEYVLDVKAGEWWVLKLFLEYPGIDLNIQYDQKRTIAQLLEHFLSAPTLEIDDVIFEYLKAKQEHHALKNQTAPALSQRHKTRF